jgi:hypothetical protein
MFVKLSFHGNILNSVEYNEIKVKEGKATIIGAEGFLKDHDQLSLQDKLDRFQQRSSLNEAVVKNAVHISVNFGATEKLTDEKMALVGNRFMNGIGFEDQPYLMYRHNDAGHTHMHIVATNIRADGDKINLGPLELLEAHKITRRLEEEFLLERSIRWTAEDQQQFNVLHAAKVVYGETGLKRSISDVLNAVVDHYNYTSLDEFNAILREYNVIANTGGENSRLRQVGGLLYHALDEDGEKIGIPLKASGFLIKPTLNKLEEKFALNQSPLRESVGDRLRTAIEWAFAGQLPDWTGLQNGLERDGISTVVTGSIADSAEHLFFVDHTNKTAFSGESLGSQFSLSAIRERCSAAERVMDEESLNQHLKLSI